MRYGPEDFNYTFVRSEEDEAAAADVEAGLKNEPDDEQLDQPEKPSDAATAAAASSTPADDPLRRSSRAADESTKPYVYVPPKKYGLGRGRGGDGLSDDDVLGGAGGGGAAEALAALIGGSGACCCCIAATLVIAGGIMLAYERYDRPEGSVSNEGLALAGIIVLILAVAAFLLGCCSCCFGCVAACAYPPGGGGGTGGVGPFGGALGGPPMDYDDERNVKVQFKRLNDRYEKAESA